VIFDFGFVHRALTSGSENFKQHQNKKRPARLLLWKTGSARRALNKAGGQNHAASRPAFAHANEKLSMSTAFEIGTKCD